MKFMPGGHGTFFVMLNTFVHIIMYTYYMLAAVGPQMQKYLWWKKYLTMLQLVQFVGIFVHSSQLFISNPCKFPIGLVWFVWGHAVMFFGLFSGLQKETKTLTFTLTPFNYFFAAFYQKAYVNNKEEEKSKSIEKNFTDITKVD
jgi:phosphatidylglycerophosphate synthase